MPNPLQPKFASFVNNLHSELEQQPELKIIKIIKKEQHAFFEFTEAKHVGEAIKIAKKLLPHKGLNLSTNGKKGIAVSIENNRLHVHAYIEPFNRTT
ncbi:hypothetical protein HUU53_00695 [Candidatus Micrarchaeota archaeon]|nr:hypothetical protein [Candidatus Micrarchaeota archaeon]